MQASSGITSWFFATTSPEVELERCKLDLQESRDSITTTESQKKLLTERINFTVRALQNPKCFTVRRVSAECTVAISRELLAKLDDDIVKDKAHIQELLTKKIALETQIALREYEMRNAQE